MKFLTLSQNKNLLFVIFIISLIGLIGVISVIKGNDILGIFLSLIFFFFFFAVFRNYPDPILLKILLFAFILRAFFAYFQRFVAPLPDSLSDALGFEKTGWEVAQSWLFNTPLDLPELPPYPKIIGVLYYFFGRAPLVAQFFNVFLGTFIVFLVYKITLTLFENKQIAQTSAKLCAIFPAFNLYSAILLRESLIVFFFSLSFLFFIFWLKKRNFKDFFLSIVFIFISSIFHGAVILIGFIYIFFFTFYNLKKQKWEIWGPRLFGGIILLLIIYSLFYGNFQNKVPKISEIRPELLTKKIEAVAKGRTMYLKNLYPKNYFDILWQTPIRILPFYFGPPFWNVKEGLDLLGFLDGLLYLILFALVFKSLLKIKKENKALFWLFLFILIIFSITFAWGTSNYGTALRHRQKIAFILIALASFSLRNKNKALKK